MGGFQDLIGVLVTLVAAFIGFGGVIYSQRALTRMTREQEDTKARRELRSFQNAMIGELSALQQSIGQQLELLGAQIEMAEELAKSSSSRKTQPRVTFRFVTPVFDSHVSQIGLLSPDLSFKTSSLYGSLKSYSVQSQSEVPEMEAGIAARVMHSVNEGLTGLLSQIDELKVAMKAEMKASLSHQ